MFLSLLGLLLTDLRRRDWMAPPCQNTENNTNKYICTSSYRTQNKKSDLQHMPEIQTLSEICKVQKIHPNQYPTSRKFCQDLLFKEFFLITIIVQKREFQISLVPLNMTNGHAYQRPRYLKFLGMYIIYQVPTLDSGLSNLQRHVAENVTERSGQHLQVHLTIIKRGSKPANL